MADLGSELGLEVGVGQPGQLSTISADILLGQDAINGAGRETVLEDRLDPCASR